MEGGVRVGAPERLHQGGCDVKVGVPLPVVAHGRLLSGSPGVLQSDKQFPLLTPGSSEQELNGVHSLAHVSPAGRGDVLPDPILAPDLRPQPLPHDGHPPVDGREHILSGDLFKLEHTGPG